MIYLDVEDDRGVELYLSKGNLNPLSLQMWQRLVAAHSWTDILDVGANYGEMLVGIEFPPGSRIQAFEPNPVLRKYLTRSLRESNVGAEVHGFAVGDTVTNVSLNVDPRWSGTSSVSHPVAGSNKIEVKQVSLDEHCQTEHHSIQRRSFLIKVDVEGYEPHVLAGMQRLVAQSKSIAIMAEVMHLGKDFLANLSSNFTILLFESSTGKFVQHASYEDVPDELYKQDAVLIQNGDMHLLRALTGAA